MAPVVNTHNHPSIHLKRLLSQEIDHIESKKNGRFAKNQNRFLDSAKKVVIRSNRKKTNMAKTSAKGPASVHEILREFVTDKFLPSAGKEDFDDDDSFMENGIIDSTGVLELLEFIEDQFDIGVEDEEIIPDNLDSISKLAAFIHKKKENVS